MNIPPEFTQMLITYAERIFFALVIFIVGRIVIKFLNRLVRRASQRKELDSTLKSFLTSTISTVLNILLILTIASTLGIHMTSFVAVIGAASLAVGLSLQGSLSNFAGGVLILLFRPFNVGDFIEAQGILGSVAEIKILYTVLNTPDNKRVVIPNGNLANSTVTNFSVNPTRRVDLVFGISYDDSIDHAKEVISKLVDEHELILKDPAPIIGVTAHADSSIDFAVRVWCERANFLKVMFGLNEEVKKAFDREGITIPYPQRDVHIYSENLEKKG